jgi:plastocyanin
MRNNRVLFITFLMMGVGILSGCTQQQTPPPGNTNTVTIKNFAFDPSTITIKAGENVTWTNEDSAPHQVKEDAGLFLSSSLSNGQSFTYRFTAVGTYNYTCNIHSSMHGKVIVE